MKVEPGSLEGLLIIEPSVFGDERGFFMEAYSRDRYAEAGLPREFVQDNVSLSARGILRGLHLQNPRGQGKLCFVLEGDVFDVAVDVRVGSPTFGRWEGLRERAWRGLGRSGHRHRLADRRAAAVVQRPEKPSPQRHLAGGAPAVWLSGS